MNSRMRMSNYCAICRCSLTPENIGDRKDFNGRDWCQKCLDEHDSIDWEESK